MPTRIKTKTSPNARRRGLRRLEQYSAKRNLAASGEPAGEGLTGTHGSVRRFVIQKHDATRLHYDLRLEMDGVYRSWAVPKGLPEEPGARTLAVEVEDHPLEYGTFEGVIPEGNYGAGTVMLWDRGHYTVAGGSPEQAYRGGKIHLGLVGEKSVGEWTLVRMPPRSGDRHTHWLLIRNRAVSNRVTPSGTRDLSVLSGRSMDEIAVGRSPTAGTRRTRTTPPAGRGRSRRPAHAAKRRSSGRGTAVALAPAAFIPPMKAVRVDTVPKGKWRVEVKFDGYRAIAVINAGAIELWSRNHKPLTSDYPEIVEALKRIRCSNAVIDGEVVALDAEGRSRFQLLQNRGGDHRPRIVYYVFDLLHHDGRSMLGRPIEERQIALEVLVGKRSDAVRSSPVFDMAPETLLAAARKQGLEGIIAKTPGSPYEPDRRSGAWLKCKVHGEQEFVIGGFTPPRHTRPHFGAILVGYHENGRLRYAGKVGSGFAVEQLGRLHREFMKRRQAECPFADLPALRRPRFGTGMTAGAMKDVTWLRPELVAQVRFTEWTDDGALRQPVFLGLRKDKRPDEVVRE